MAPRRPGRPTLLPVALGLAMAVSMLAGCSTQQTPEGTGTAPPVDASAARRLIEAAKLDDPASMDALGAILFTVAGEQAARDVLEAGASGDTLWAAVWVYASAGADPAPVRPLLQNGSPSIRVMAAAALVAFGDASGFQVLREALDNEHELAGSHPPVTVGGFAVATLARYVVGSGVPPEPQTEELIGDLQASWASWLDGHASALVFDGSHGTWTAP